jgi:hypothetical protein
VLILFLFGGAVKGWLVSHSEVLARDGVGYIQFAARLGKEPCGEVLRSEQQHPLYPLCILTAHQLLRHLTSNEADCLAWQTSAQLANLLGGVLLALPMFLMGRDLFDRRVGFWGALLFQILPVPARVTADSLSEGTYLLWVAWAMYLAIRGLQTRNPPWFLLCGAAGAFAYLVRPEGALIIVLAGVMLLFMQIVHSWRLPWLRLPACVGGLALAAALTAAPYWYTIGHVSNKPATREFIDSLINKAFVRSSSHDEARLIAKHAGSLLLASRFSEGTDGLDHHNVSTLFVLIEVLDEVCKSFYYVTWVPLLLGLPWYVRRIRKTPGLLLLLLLVLVSFLVLWRLAAKVHYVSERHTLLIVMCGCMLSAATLFHWGRVLASLRATQASHAGRSWLCWTSTRRGWRRAVQLVFLILLGIGLLQTLKPLHQHRLGHKEVGLWLARQLKPGDSLVDPYGLASFYADQRLARPNHIDADVKKKGHRYLLVEPADKDRHRLQLIAHEKQRMGTAEAVFSWPNERNPELLVYKSSKKRVVSANTP